MIANNEERRIFRTGLMVERAIFPEMPLTYQEMLMLVPADILKPDHPKHKKVVGLIQVMARHLEDGFQNAGEPVYKRFLKRGGTGKGGIPDHWNTAADVGGSVPAGYSRL